MATIIRTKILSIVALALGLGGTSLLTAQTTITTPDETNYSSWGPGSFGNQAYGESFTVPTSSTLLKSFTFTSIAMSADVNYVTSLYAFNTTTSVVVGPALYTSGVKVVGTTPEADNNTINVNLASGGTYLIFVSAAGQTQTHPTAEGTMGATNSDLYPGGAFYYDETNGSTAYDTQMWSTYQYDAAFTAVFAPPGLIGFGQGLTPNQYAIGGPINAGIMAGNVNPNFVSLVNALQAQPDLGTALDQLSPEAFGRFTSETAFNNASFETEAMDNYLAGRRDGHGLFLGGNGTIDSSGLTLNDPSYDPGLSMVHSRLLAWNPAPFTGTMSDVANPMMGGVDMKSGGDSKNMKSVSAPAYTDPWNFYVRGNVILAQGFSQIDVSHFDDNTESVVLGVDYRFTPNFLMGLTAGYGHTDVTLDDEGSSATVDSYSPGFYASYADGGWYANAVGDYVHNAYTQDRNIGFLGQTASSAPEGNEGVADLDGGYDFHHGALTYGPLAGLQYTHLSVDGYGETGSLADLAVNDQETDSLRSRLGGRFSYAMTCRGVTLRPHFDASWQHEFMDQGRGVTSQFDGAGLGSFSVRTDNPSRDFALADVGLDVDINQTATAFVDYVVQAGQDNYFGQSVQGGVKIGF